MSIGAINQASFSIKPLHESAYELNIQFSDKNTFLSEKKFTFLQQPSIKEGRILDVFTKNGECTSSIEKLFTKKEVQEVKSASCQLEKLSLDQERSLVAVLDLKDKEKHYLPSSQQDVSIPVSEEIVCDFFKEKNTPIPISKEAKKIHSFFKKSLPVDFIICEGSLKMDLLQRGGFSEREVEYLNSSSGAIDFCQCAEFFMNGFKLGQSAQSRNSEFLADKFIKSISSQSANFQPQTTSTVFYPSLYKEIYSTEGAFAKTLQPAFSVSGEFLKETKITVLNIKTKV